MSQISPRTPPILDPPIRLAVCVSGGGSTLQNLLDRMASGSLRAQVTRVIASRPGIGAIERAERAGVPVSVVTRKGQDVATFSRDVFQAARAGEADLVILGGFLSLIQIPQDFVGRVVNVH
ncbi:MAG TPA: formyltransferase family protein, partial [Isosphaeraceae bacterium]|nr:formyltransferase family protein [Isosphaeraceae bacterium]